MKIMQSIFFGMVIGQQIVLGFIRVDIRHLTTRMDSVEHAIAHQAKLLEASAETSHEFLVENN